MKQNLLIQKFRDIRIADPFFDSLKEDYAEFSAWFEKKAIAGESAIVFIEDEKLQGFLYPKLEDGNIEGVIPEQLPMRRYKIGTFKINAHGTKLGERFLKKMLDLAISRKVEEIYVTVFPKHESLIHLFATYGFVKVGEKTTGNGVEDVMTKTLGRVSTNVLHHYPFVAAEGVSKWLLAIKPEFHTPLFPYSILNNETYDQVKDVSFTNSIHKVYVSYLDGLDRIRPGDLVLIYRTTDVEGKARFRSVVTSLCTVEEVKFKKDFSSKSEYVAYCERFSVFDSKELNSWWDKFPALKFGVIKMCYNAAFSKKVTRGDLIEKVGLDESQRWGLLELNEDQFKKICSSGAVEKLILD